MWALLVGLFVTHQSTTSCQPGTFIKFSSVVNRNLCWPCPRGKYGPHGNVCHDCPAGYLQVQDAATSCKHRVYVSSSQAPAASTGSSSYSTKHAITVYCGKGHFLSPTLNSCVACAPGFFQVLPFQKACNACPELYYNAHSKAVSCIVCPSGKYSSVKQAADACTSCPHGYYQPDAKSGSCLMCPGGKFSGEGYIAASGCNICPSGTFSLTAQVECTLCPAGTFGPGVGYSSPECGGLCSLGHYSTKGTDFYFAFVHADLCLWFVLALGSIGCIGCPAGRYGVAGRRRLGQQQYRSSGMVPKRDGSNSLGWPPCEDCPGGKWSPTESMACKLCPAGRFGSREAKSEHCSGTVHTLPAC